MMKESWKSTNIYRRNIDIVCRIRIDRERSFSPYETLSPMQFLEAERSQFWSDNLGYRANFT